MCVYLSAWRGHLKYILICKFSFLCKNASVEVENYVQILKSLWSFTPLSMYNFAVLLRCTYRLKCFNFVSILYLDSSIYFNHGNDRTQHSLISANCVLVRIAEYSGISEKRTIIIILFSPNYYPLWSPCLIPRRSQFCLSAGTPKIFQDRKRLEQICATLLINFRNQELWWYAHCFQLSHAICRVLKPVLKIKIKPDLSELQKKIGEFYFLNTRHFIL